MCESGVCAHWEARGSGVNACVCVGRREKKKKKETRKRFPLPLPRGTSSFHADANTDNAAKREYGTASRGTLRVVLR